MVAVGEGAQAASDQGHGAEAGPSMAGGVGAGGVLLAVLPAVAWGLQAVVRARERHLHGSWKKLWFLVLQMLETRCFLVVERRFVLIFLFVLREVESRESRPVLFQAAESHMEITREKDGVMGLVSFFLSENPYATCQIWTCQLCSFGQRAESRAGDPELG